MTHFTLNCKEKLVVVDSPVIMGILNLTPDSFFDGGKYLNEAVLLNKAEQMLNEGATIIDIGGMSTRPNAEVITEEEELKRVIKPISLIHRHFPDAILSIDTFRSKVAAEAVLNGVSVINDISGGTEDEHIFEVAAKFSCPYVLMHKQGSVQTMHKERAYENIITDILDYFVVQTEKAKNFGIKDVILDVGFGFSKTTEQNYTLLKNLSVFKQFNKPILVGLSRKSMLCKLLNIKPEFALNATTAVNMAALCNGAAILRVHDVKEAMQCVKIYHQIQLS